MSFAQNNRWACHWSDSGRTYSSKHAQDLAYYAPQIVFYGLFLIYMLMATLTPAYIFTPYGKLGSPAAKYQWSIGVNALIASCALFSVAISTILLRNSFARAISSIEAIDTGLITELGSSFAHLVRIKMHVMDLG